MKRRSLIKGSGRTALVAVTVAALALGLSAGGASAVDTHAGWPVYFGAPGTGYGKGDAGLRLVSNANRTVSKRILLSGRDRADDVVITPGGGFALVASVGHSSDGGEDSTYVSRVSVATSKQVTPIEFVNQAEGPQCIAISPDGKTLYVGMGDELASEGDGWIQTVDMTTRKLGPSIHLSVDWTWPRGIAFSPDGKKAFVAWARRVAVIDVATHKVIREILTEGLNRDAVVTPDGKAVYVLADPYYGATDSPSLSRIDPVTYEVTQRIPLRNRGTALAMAPNGRTAYVAQIDGDLVGVNLVTGLRRPPITIGGTLTDVAVTPDGAVAYVTKSQTQTVQSVDLATGTVGAGAPARYPGSVAITPDQAPVASFTATKLTTRKVRFDASASTVKYGKVAQYKWKFGDGVERTTTTPTTTHIYTGKGTYRAVLTAVSSAGTSTVKVFTGAMMLRNGSPQAKTTRTFTLP